VASQEQAAAQPPAAGKVVISNVRVFDGTELLPDRTVVIENGVIGAVLEGPVPDGAGGDGGLAGVRLIDGAGGVLLPGLFDAHVHLDGPGRLETLASYGVTTVFDMASLPEETNPLRGRAGGTQFLSAGLPAIAPGSLHSHLPGVGQRGLIGGADGAAEFVARRIAEGSDYIKIVIGSPFADHDQDTIDALVAAAHAAGKQVVAHASAVESVRKAQAAGADILTHAPLDGTLTAEAAAEAASAGRVAVPTLAMMEGLVRNLGLPGMDYACARDSVAALHAAGVPILAGTDANDTEGTPSRIPHGDSLHHELELLVEAGLSTREALLAATSVPARYFGLTDRGVIEAGKRADLVLLDADPLADIRATRSIVRIWCGGSEHSPAQTRK
jgi:imidazolonepropionase-like amidohydrolase